MTRVHGDLCGFKMKKRCSAKVPETLHPRLCQKKMQSLSHKLFSEKCSKSTAENHGRGKCNTIRHLMTKANLPRLNISFCIVVWMSVLKKTLD